MNTKHYAKERDAAFIDAVMNDNWNAVKKFCKKYKTPIPRSERVMKAGVYKAVQYCTDIPNEVKTKAAMECLRMGFTPFIKPYEDEHNG